MSDQLNVTASELAAKADCMTKILVEINNKLGVSSDMKNQFDKIEDKDKPTRSIWRGEAAAKFKAKMTKIYDKHIGNINKNTIKYPKTELGHLFESSAKLKQIAQNYMQLEKENVEETTTLTSDLNGVF